MTIAAFSSVRDETPEMVVQRDLLRTLEPLGLKGRLWIASLFGVVGLGVYAYIVQLTEGLRVTGMRDYVSWGLYMTNFVFFIGISHAGTLISAILRVTNAGWRRPITRMAEAITVFALMVGAPMVIIDMGRPDRLLNVFTHGRMQSPILWDVCSIMTYLSGSVLYLYVAMIPDMTILARWAHQRRKRAWLVRLYKALSLGYRGTPGQQRRLDIALAVMAVIIIPVAVSVHTVVSWIFGMTLRPGWHSTIFGPYFVIGAIFSGTAAIITAMAAFRKAYGLEHYLRPEHFRNLARLLLALTLLYAYFTLSEYLTTWYGGLATEARLVDLLMGPTPYGASFWFWVVSGLFLPLGFLILPGRRSIASIVTASLLINVGMWLKRYLIVVPTLQTTYLPAEAAGAVPTYFPTWVEGSITVAALAAFLLLYTLFSRLFPILSIWETAEDAAEGKGTHEPDTHGPERFRHAPAWMLGGMLLTGLCAVGGLGAQEPAPDLHVEKVDEGGEEVLLATATLDGLPLEGVRIGFFVTRTFGAMALGEDVTLDDGTAAVAFPVGLPGNATGELQVSVEILAPPQWSGARGTALVPGGAVTSLAEATFPRALWSPRAPLGLPITIGALLAFVWTLSAVVIAQLVEVRMSMKGRTRHERW